MKTQAVTWDKLDDMTRQYLETALWSTSHGEDGNLDDNHGIEDVSQESIDRAITDCRSFRLAAKLWLDELGAEYDDGKIGHDFLLTRNGHGAGFWDGDYPKKIGDELTRISHGYGEVNFYLGDDGKIYS